MIRGNDYVLQLLFMAAVGAFALAGQTILLRELMVVAWGNELVFGIGLGCWLAGVYGGARFGTGLCRRRPGHSRSLLIAAGPMLVLFGFGVLFFIRLMKGIVHIPAGQMPGYGMTFLVAGSAFVIAAFPVGFTFPLMVQRLAGSSQGGQNHTGTRVYIAEGAGAFFMSLVLVILFAFHAGGEVCLLVASTPVLVLALLDAWRNRSRHRVATLISFVMVLVLVRLGGPWSLEQRWRQLAVGERVTETETPYQLLQKGQLDTQVQIAANGKMILSYPDPVTARLKVTRLMAQHPAVRRVLVAGPVPSDEAKAWGEWGSVEVVSVVLDPVLHELTGAVADGIMRTHGDLRDKRFREQLLSGGTFDLIVLDATAPSGALVNRYLTREFMVRLGELLSRDGVAAISMPSLVNYGEGQYGLLAGILVTTVRTVFPYRAFSAGSPHWLFACRIPGIVTETPDVIGDRLRGKVPDWKRVSRYLAMDVDPERISMIRDTVAQTGDRLNTDERPVLALAFGKLSGWYSGSGAQRVLDWLERMPFLLVMLPLVMIVIRLSPVDRSGTMVPVAAMGFAAMSMQMVLIYALQLMGGSVYSRVAMLSGCFMLGLPLGAALMERLVAVRRPLQIPLLGALFLQAVFLLLWRTGQLSPGLLVPFNLAVGFVTGAMFPAAMRTMETMETGVSVRAGRIDAADHLGAASGAVFAGAAGLLILGVSGTVLLAIAVIGVSMLPVSGKQR